MRTPAFKCGDDKITNVASLTVFLPDFDNDLVPDEIDLDDDNDGILDTEEGEDDLDNNGEPNRRDLDSDGDGCPDVQEAGLYDPDDNGIVTIGSTSEVKVDAQGLVIASSNGTPIQASQGYTTPSAIDGDNNGTLDYKEVGSPITNIVQPPSSISTLPNAAVQITINFTVTGTVTYKWQQKISNSASWIDLNNASPYSGVDTKTLQISDPSSMHRYKFRVIVSTPSYVCQPDVTSSETEIIISVDNDDDGVLDGDDLDDDNDGILDTEEQNNDLDNDGLPNYFDLDSDGDGCPDVLEAGFSDPNGDSILANLPVVVDGLGLVVGTNRVDGYTNPNDLDGNGVKDYLEAGSKPTFTSHPQDISVLKGSATFFTFVASAQGTLTYQWQLSTDGGVDFSDITDATSASYETAAVVAGDSGNQYRVKVNTSAGAVEVLSNAATLTVTE